MRKVRSPQSIVNRLLFLVTGFWLLVSFSVYAVEIEPMRLEYSLQPGKIYSGSFKIKNSSNFSTEVFVSAGEYRYILSQGVILPSDEKKKTLPSCKEWFQFEKIKLRLSPGESADLKFTIKVPKEAKEEHLCAVLFDEKNRPEEIKQKTGNVQIQLTPRFSIPVYISIKGNEKISAEIKDMPVILDSQKGGIIANIALENSGTVHIRPFGTLIILNQKEEVIKNLPIGRTLPIFPAYTEIIPVICPKVNPGKYSIVATIEISKDNIIQKKNTFLLTETGEIK